MPLFTLLLKRAFTELSKCPFAVRLDSLLIFCGKMRQPL